MRTAKEYIVFPLDLPTVEQASRYIRQLSDCVGMFKVGLELFVRGGSRILQTIRNESDAKIFLDLKIHDIPETVRRAMEQIAGWKVDFTTVHCGESPHMLAAAVEGSRGKVSVLGVTVLTSVSAEDIGNAGFESRYAENIADLVALRAETAHAAGCAGVVCSGREVKMIKERFGPDFVAMVPGIRPAWSLGEKDDQKRVVTPAAAIENGADYLVIGRPIRDAEEPEIAAEMVASEIDGAL
ncbi:MAG: orotidine-5'-phosphate decarboxylase [Desulfosalsimonadaceae bacterium]